MKSQNSAGALSCRAPDAYLPGDLHKIERRSSVGVEQIKNADQHEERTDHRVEDELDRGVNPSLASPDPDQEIHRDQHDFPENVKEHQVERAEHSDHSRLERKKTDHERFDLLRYRLPGRENGQRRQKCSQDHQEKADAVDPEMMLNAVGRSLDPCAGCLKLHVAAGRVKMIDEMEREDECDQRAQKCDDFDGPVEAARNEQQQQGGQRRKVRHHGEDIGNFHIVASSSGTWKYKEGSPPCPAGSRRHSCV